MLRALVLLSLGLLAVADCTSYASSYNANCGAMDIYVDAAQAQTQCAKWPSDTLCNVSSGTECTGSNSWQCREYHAEAAAGNPSVHCPHAAPNGGITTVSGNPCQAPANTSIATMSNGNCDDYCNWVVSVCPTYYGLNDLNKCRAACKYLTGATATDYSPAPPSTYPLTGPSTGNTLACKRYHVEVASTTAPDVHCPHATVGGGQCGSDCETYCDIYLGACAGDATNQFANKTQCAEICAMYHSDPANNFSATTGNTLQCRIYHAIVASTGTANAATHCPHAGQFPTAACVDAPPTNCDSFCDRYAMSCPGDLNIYGGNKSACLVECAKWPSDANCNAGTGDLCSFSNSWQCRAYHAMAAGYGFTGYNTTHCPHAAPNGGITGISNGLCQEGTNVNTGVTTNGNCDDYCNWVVSVCPTYYGLNDMDLCRAACKNIYGANDTTYSPNPPTSVYPVTGPATGSTLSCKRYHAYVAGHDGPVATHCPHATAGGGACGSDCEFYCDLFMGSCSGLEFSFANRAACLATCAQYHTNATMFTATTGNNLQCRIYHAIAASAGPAAADTHCKHASQFPTAFCVDPAPTDCTTFCNTYLAGCNGTNNVYTNQTNCERECSFWPSDNACTPGGPDVTGCTNSNSQQCRSYHALLAGSGFTGYADIHCPHASPVGSGPGQNFSNMYCTSRAAPDIGVANNGNCDDYCNQVLMTCGVPSRALCLSSCKYVNGSMDNTYSLNSYPPADPGSENSLKCRRYHAFVASTSAAAAVTHCKHALTGSNVCGSNCDFYCDLMLGACNTSYASRSECLTACGGLLSNGGNFSVTEGNTMECRTYHAMVATSGATNAAVHCPHAIAACAADTPCGSASSLTVGFVTVLLAVVAAFLI